MQSRSLPLVAAAFLLAGCGVSGGSPSVTTAPTSTRTPTPTPTPVVTASPEPVGVLIAAGDIASCDRELDSATAALVAGIEGTVATLGDNVYPFGSDETYAECYDPAWGGLLDRTRPAAGNHDVDGDGGDAYFRYFGEAAGPAGQGWYSYDLATWHVVVLNSNCARIGCGEGSEQLEWLVGDLAASDAQCTLAYWHHPRFSSGPHGDYEDVGPMWEALQVAGADVVLAGHDHDYERFAPQTADRQPSADGLRAFVAGTGGKELRPVRRAAPNSEVIIDDAFGVLVLTLAPDRYAWSFQTVDGEEADAGAAACH